MHRTLSLSPQNVAQKRKVSKIWTISYNNSETVRDRMSVTIKVSKGICMFLYIFLCILSLSSLASSLCIVCCTRINLSTASLRVRHTGHGGAAESALRRAERSWADVRRQLEERHWRAPADGARGEQYAGGTRPEEWRDSETAPASGRTRDKGDACDRWLLFSSLALNFAVIIGRHPRRESPISQIVIFHYFYA